MAARCLWLLALFIIGATLVSVGHSTGKRLITTFSSVFIYHDYPTREGLIRLYKLGSYRPVGLCATCRHWHLTKKEREIHPSQYF